MVGWKEILLNQAGKEVLIKVVIQAIPTYVMAIVKIPLTFCKSLCSMVAKFWWGNSKGGKGVHWKSWAVLSSNKSTGGIGFKDFNELNLAYLSKQALRFLQNPFSLWVRILTAVHCQKDEFWRVSRKHGRSWSWNILLSGRDSLKEHARWRVGNGRELSVSEDLWLASGKPALLKEGQLDVKVADLLIKHERRWNPEAVGNALTSNSAIEAIQTPISWFDKKDNLCPPPQSLVPTL